MDTTMAPSREAAIPIAAYALAARITGHQVVALEALDAAARTSGAADLVRSVRVEARARRGGHRAGAVSRPPALAPMPDEQWDVVEGVALRGFLLREVAEELGIPVGTAALRLHAGLQVARSLLADGEAGGQQRSTARRPARLDRAARRRHDAVGDRQAEAAPGPCVAL